MPLMPKRVKHRKVQRGNNAGLSQRCNQLDFGDFGLQTMERSQLTANQIEAARVAITRSPTSRIRKSRLKSVWEKGRALSNTGWRRSSRAECFSRSAAVLKRLPRRR